MVRPGVVGFSLAALAVGGSARAEEGAPIEAAAAAQGAPSTAAPGDAPPLPPPRHGGIVAASSLGVLGFAGQFRKVSPPGVWMSTQVGYELFSRLFVFVDGELMMTDTSVANGPTTVRAFPIFGFGAGARFTVHPTERVSVFAQGNAGLLKADVPENALQNLGFMNAERLRPSLGARLGVESYQVNPHLAVGVLAGARLATGFARDGRSDTPLAWEGAATVRYTF